MNGGEFEVHPSVIEGETLQMRDILHRVARTSRPTVTDRFVSGAVALFLLLRYQSDLEAVVKENVRATVDDFAGLLVWPVTRQSESWICPRWDTYRKMKSEIFMDTFSENQRLRQ